MVEEILNMSAMSKKNRFFCLNCFKYYSDGHEELQTKSSNPLRLWDKYGI